MSEETKIITVKVPLDWLAALDAWCAEQGRHHVVTPSRAQAIRWMAAQHIARDTVPNRPASKTKRRRAAA